MFADYFPSTDSTNEIRDHTVKDQPILQYKAKPTSSPDLTKDRLDPEPRRTSRACGIRLSQDHQNNALRVSVNKNLNFLSVPGSGGALACWFRCLADTNFLRRFQRSTLNFFLAS